MTVGQQRQWNPAFRTHRVTPGSPHSLPPPHIIAIYYGKKWKCNGEAGKSHAWKCQLYSPWLFLSSGVQLIRLPPLSPVIPQLLLTKRLRMITSSQMHSLIVKKKKKLLESNYLSYFVNPSLWRLPELLVNHCLLLSLHFPFLSPPKTTNLFSLFSLLLSNLICMHDVKLFSPTALSLSSFLGPWCYCGHEGDWH